MNIYIACSICMIAGFLLGMIFARPFIIGRIVIDTADDAKDKMAFLFDRPVADIYSNHRVTFKVVRK